MTADRDSRGIDLKTLIITAVASAVAAYTCSKLWAPGTLFSAAFTPVLVAIIKETLHRPTEVVTRAVPVRGVVRSARARRGDAPARNGDPAPRREMADGPPTRAAPHLDDADEPPTRVAPHLEDAAEQPTRVAQPGMIADGGPRSSPSATRWRLAVVTGLLGFAVCVIVLTVPELVAGGSAAGGDRQTTLFGGDSKSKKRDETTPTTTAPTRTAPAPEQEAPVAPPATAAPAPPTTTPPPPATTPAPPAQPAPVAP